MTGRLRRLAEGAPIVVIDAGRACVIPIATALLATARAGQAHAQDALASIDRVSARQDVIGVFLILALVLIATVTTLLHLAARQHWTRRESSLVGENADLRAALDRAEMFLAAEPQIVVVWRSAREEADIEGDLSLVTDAPIARRVLGFGAWLPAPAAQAFEGCIERLRERGEGFRLALTSLAGRHLEAEGRAVSGRAVLRIRDVSGDRLELTRLRARHGEVLTELEAMRALLNAIPSAVWMRDEAGALAWVNTAYVRAVESIDAGAAVAGGVELLDRGARIEAETGRVASGAFRKRVTGVVAGARHLLDIIDIRTLGGSIGYANDLSELEDLRADLNRQTAAHTRTLDQLSTAVAIFDRSKRLVFHNAAYRELWGLDQNIGEQAPSDSELLDRLRAARRLPEQADFRSWKAELLSNYQSTETVEQVWHLPDSRTLRVVINPNPQGGVTYLFDDVSERFHLESRYNSIVRVQGETLDHLREGVAVFGSDGRLKLFNPAFAELWSLDPAELADRPHIDAVARLCSALYDDEEAWTRLRSIVSGLDDARVDYARRLMREDASAVDCSAAPLPDGGTLITFADMTAGVAVERALTDRNNALLEAEKLRNDFVHHVSYELRSPLTNIIGFIQLLSGGSVGELNAKQLEYASYIMTSSAALLAIINDILDLATIDKDGMALTLEEVDVRKIIDSAADGLQDRLAESAIHLQIIAMDNVATFRADGKRMRQILHNLLSNAIGFSSPGQTVTLAAMRRKDAMVFKISDQGRGIPLDVLDRVFDRFHSHTVGTRHRGVGLGLSIVRALVELHGGEARIQSAPGEGTTVTCIFPLAGDVHAPSIDVA